MLLCAGCELPTETSVDCPIIVQRDGEPVVGANVIAIPPRLRDDRDWDLPFFVGRTDDQGIAHLESEVGTEGLLPGFYDVWIVERSEVRSVMGGPTRANLSYSLHRIQVVSSSVTPRIELRHEPLQELLNVEIAEGGWAQTLPRIPASDLPRHERGLP